MTDRSLEGLQIPASAVGRARELRAARVAAACFWTGCVAALAAAVPVAAQTVVPRSGAGSTPARAQTPIEHRPYRIQVLCTFAGQARFNSSFRRRILHDTEVLIRRTVGDPWQCQVAQAGSELWHCADDRNSGRGDEILARCGRGFDKVFLAHVAWAQGRYQLRAREFDTLTQHAGPTRSKTAVLRDRLDRDIVELCLAVFSPVAELIDGAPAGMQRLSVKGASLVTADPSIQLVRSHDLFSLYRLFQTERQDQPQLVDWTYLVAERIDGSAADCRVHSAYRAPTTGRARGRLIALGVRPTEKPTQLRFVGRNGSPLAGYEVHFGDARRQTASTVRTTNLHGWVSLPASDGLLQVSVRSGTQTLARLFVLSGPATDGKEVVVPDDPVRLQVESRLARLQDAMIDEVAARTLTIRRVQALMDRDRWDDAQRLLDRLNPSNRPFQSRLDQIRTDATQLAGEQGAGAMHPKVEEMLDAAQRGMDVLLKPKPIEDLRAEFSSRRRAAEAGASG